MTLEITGVWHPQGQSRQYPATLVLGEQEYTLQAESTEPRSGQISDIKVSDRLANIPRRLTLEDHSVFITQDNAAVDHWLKLSKGKTGLLHRLESSKKYALLAVVLSLLAIFGFFKFGLPFAASHIAQSLPHSISRIVSRGALSLLEDEWFEPSEISAERQSAIRQRFRGMLIPHHGNKPYALNFRKMGMANAFALPDGNIFIADELINLAEDDKEIDSVLLHEIGHVENMHTMRLVVQSSITTLILAYTVGDIAGIEEWTLALPTLLMNTGFSRKFETEADQYALERMKALNISPTHFGNILRRLTQTNGDFDLGYLSTHPSTDQRIQLIQP